MRTEAWLHAYAFRRTCTRRRRLKFRADCGHYVDGSRHGTELYRYMVWRLNCDPRGTIHQRTDCEVCSRAG